MLCSVKIVIDMVMVLVREGIDVVRRCDLETNCELLWIELLSHQGSTLLGIFYRPPYV